MVVNLYDVTLNIIYIIFLNKLPNRYYSFYHRVDQDDQDLGEGQVDQETRVRQDLSDHRGPSDLSDLLEPPENADVMEAQALL